MGANRWADRIDGLMLTVPVVRAQRDRRNLPPRTILASDPAVVADVRPEEESWLEFSVVQTREMLNRFRAVPIRPADGAFLDRLQPNYAFSFEDQLTTRIAAPALIVAGRQDSIVGFADALPLLAHLPRATFAVLDRAGHALEDEQQALFQTLTHEWLDRVDEFLGRRHRQGATSV